MYVVLVKVNPGQFDLSLRELKRIPEKPSNGVTLHHICNVFGSWDFYILFEADTADNALNFVQTRVNSITGVIKTYVMPMTELKRYDIPKIVREKHYRSPYEVIAFFALGALGGTVIGLIGGIHSALIGMSAGGSLLVILTEIIERRRSLCATPATSQHSD
jgi:uncharacterized protein with GYD domain